MTVTNELARPPRGKAVGEDLRRRVVAAVLEEGMTYRAAGERFGVDPTSVYRWAERFRARGNVRADRPAPGRLSKIEPARDLVFRLLEARPALTVRALRRALAAEGIQASAAAVQRFLNRHGLQRRQRLAGRPRKPGPRRRA